jgi:hypothetical protein
VKHLGQWNTELSGKIVIGLDDAKVAEFNVLRANLLTKIGVSVKDIADAKTTLLKV